MVLLAVITVGIYGVIMASVRSGNKPDTKEEMAYAVEQASAKFKAMIQNNVICLLWDDSITGENSCLMYDACLSGETSPGVCPPESRAPGAQEMTAGSGIFGCPYTDTTCIQAVQNAKYTTDLCGGPLQNQLNPAIVYSATQAVAGAVTPFETDKDYHLEKCSFMPSSCPGGSFYYTVVQTAEGLYNVQFHIDCGNGQTT